MLIYCPKCQQGYNVDEALIPDEGRRLRCGSCAEIFWFNRGGEVKSVVVEIAEKAEATEPLVEEEVVTELPEETPEEEKFEIGDIFQRLSEQTMCLFEREKKLTRKERFWLKFKTMTGWNLHIGWKSIVAFLLLIGAVSLYNNRYDLTRKMPMLSSLYGVFGIQSQILGEGLEFENINWAYFEEDEAPRLEIKGFITNKTKRAIRIPMLHVEMLDANTGLLKSQNQPPEQAMLKAKSRVAISIVVKNPSPTTRYVFLTFVE